MWFSCLLNAGFSQLICVASFKISCILSGAESKMAKHFLEQSFLIVEDVEICESCCRYSDARESVLWDVGYTKIYTQHEIRDRMGQDP